MFRSREKQPTSISSSHSVSIDRRPEVVMDFLLEPESAVMTGQLTERSFHVPDTPVRAIGAQYVNLSWENGLLVAVVDELVDLDYPHRAVSVDRSTPGAITVAYTCVRRADGGTDYTQEVRMQAQPTYASTLQDAFDAETVRCVTRIKEILENDEWRPSHATSS